MNTIIENLTAAQPQLVYSLNGDTVVTTTATAQDQQTARNDAAAIREKRHKSRQWLRVHKPQLRRAYRKKCARYGGVNEHGFEKQVAHINPFRQVKGPKQVCVNKYSKREAASLKAEVRRVRQELRTMTKKAKGTTLVINHS